MTAPRRGGRGDSLALAPAHPLSQPPRARRLSRPTWSFSGGPPRVSSCLTSARPARARSSRAHPRREISVTECTARSVSTKKSSPSRPLKVASGSCRLSESRADAGRATGVACTSAFQRTRFTPPLRIWALARTMTHRAASVPRRGPTRKDRTETAAQKERAEVPRREGTSSAQHHLLPAARELPPRRSHSHHPPHRRAQRPPAARLFAVAFLQTGIP
jgi:hypothetical protein